MNLTFKREHSYFKVYIFIASFLLSLILCAADDAWSATFKTVNGETVIEAENYTRLGGSVGGSWFFSTARSGFKGSGYMSSTALNPSTLSFSSSISRVEYDIDFKETGTYYVHLKSLAEDHMQNGFFATINGTPVNYGHANAYFIYVEKVNSWNWYTDGGGAEQRGYRVSFNISSPGVKRFAVYRRDKNSRLDRIWLTKNQSNPQHTGSLNLPNPSIFIVSGGSGNSEICNNGLDDDNDGRTDCNDADCSGAPNCGNPVETNCSNGLDDDNDGRTDCNDTDCSNASSCSSPVETNCGNGVDDDNDGRTDCNDTDCSSSPSCSTPVETNCGNGVDDDNDGRTDCNDTDCEWTSQCNADTVLYESFDGGQGGFQYADDEFRGTNNPQYASGDYTNGSLHTSIGGRDGVDIVNGMSGGWSRDFTVSGNSSVVISLSYRLMVGPYDANECGQALVAIDGALVSPGQDDYLEEFCGRTVRDSGWQQAEFMVNVSAGTHTITVGGWNNKKTAPGEVTDVFFDEILITKQGQGQTILNTNLGGFQYADDKFRGTNNPQYASGDYSNGSLHASIGGIDGADIINGMSGGWSSTFTLSGNANVLISMSYRLMVGRYDADECGQALVAIDGVLVSPGQQNYLEEFCGRSTLDSGWRHVQFTRNLSAGTHVITVGGWNNKKTAPGEVTNVFFNDIFVTQ